MFASSGVFIIGKQILQFEVWTLLLYIMFLKSQAL